MPSSKSITASYIRTFIFGVEDSLVSTVGLLSGIAIAGVSRPTIFLTGIVLIFVEAFSMAVGSYLSENTAEEYIRHTKEPLRVSLTVAAIMFFSYFISGFVPLLPYRAFNVQHAFWTSILLSLTFLFILGLIGARLARVPLMRRGFRMLTVGGVAIAVGILAGQIMI